MRAILIAVLLCLMVATSEAKPNLVVVLMDDMPAGLEIRMPHVQRLIVDKGISFTKAYYNDPLCCPSRATLITGRYAQNTKVTGNSHAQFIRGGHAGDTLAVWLDRAGYRTALIGKYLNGYPDPFSVSYHPPGWDYWRATVGEQTGYYNYLLLDESGQLRHYASKPEDYSDDVKGRLAVDFIRSTPADQPLFAWVSFYAPHLPAKPHPRHASLFSNLTAPRPPSFNETDVGDKPAWLRQRSRMSAAKIAQTDARYRNMARSIQAADEWVAEIIEALDDTGRLDDTYIFFLSDNGWMAGQHRLPAGKGLPYEESVRMPLYVRGPGVPEGVALEHLVGNVDIAPTLAALAGTTAPADIDGRSLAVLLRERPPMPEQWRQAYPLFYTRGADGEEGEKGTWPSWRGVRTRTHAYFEWATGERELYDMRTDPYQLSNIAATAPADLLRRLAGLTASLNRCAGAACRKADKP